MNDTANMKPFSIGDSVYETQLTAKFERRKNYVPADPMKIVCVIPGVIQNLVAYPSMKVSRGEPLLVLEAMKMQNDILSPVEGRVKAVHVGKGQMVTKGELLIELE